MQQKCRLPFVLVLLSSLAGCGGCSKKVEGGRDGEATSTTSPSANAAPALSNRPSTTSASIALSNLDADIAEQLRRNDERLVFRVRLIDMLLARSQFLARVSDAERADEIAAAISKGNKEPDVHVAHASTLAAFHKFDAALQELDEAEKLGKKKEATASSRVSILLALGKYDEAIALLPPDYEKRNYEVLSIAGVIEARRQKIDEAERLFELARTRYPDVAPFPLAWMDFQRATVLDAAGRDGKPYYAEAVDVLPPYAHAAIHLSLSEKPDDAIKRLEELRPTSEDDADVLAALADAHKRAGHAAESKKYVDLARKRFDAILAKHPEAYADHAARFFLGVGDDPAKALTLARDNAKLRETEEALDLWMAAAVGAKDQGDVCKSSIAMTKLKYLSEKGRRLATASASKCPGGG